MAGPPGSPPAAAGAPPAHPPEARPVASATRKRPARPGAPSTASLPPPPAVARQRPRPPRAPPAKPTAAIEPPVARAPLSPATVPSRPVRPARVPARRTAGPRRNWGGSGWEVGRGGAARGGSGERARTVVHDRRDGGGRAGQLRRDRHCLHPCTPNELYCGGPAKRTRPLQSAAGFRSLAMTIGNRAAGLSRTQLGS